MYCVETNDAIVSFGIAPHSVRDALTGRVGNHGGGSAAGCVDSDQRPEGQAIEGDDGDRRRARHSGRSSDRFYREWLCDPDGNWLMVGRELGGDTTPLGQIGSACRSSCKACRWC